MTDEIRECLKHGFTNFRHIKNIKTNRFRCRKCVSEAVSKRRKKLKVLAVEYKGGKCEHCDYSKCISALEFHHLDPTQKDFSVAGAGITRSWDKLKIELDKCLILCANCHREEHERLNLEN